MGTVFQRGRRWWLKWRDAAGRLHRKSSRAKTRRDALGLLAELEGAAERVRLGLQAKPADSKMSVEELFEWYLDHRCPEASRAMSRSSLRKHVYGTELAGYPAGILTPDHVESQVLEVMGAANLAPATLNRVRTIMHAAFNAASEPPRRFVGANPIAHTRVREVLKRDRPTLTPLRVAAMLDELVESRWRGVMAVGAYLGLRRGEIFALLKSDYDAGRQTLRVAASHQRQTTKGKKIAVLPVPGVLRPYLDAALKEREPASVYLFPDNKGGMRSREADPHLVLRRALVRLGIAESWETYCLTCERRGRPNIEKVKGEARPEAGRCKADGKRRRVRADPLRFRFHDLRHTCASNLIKAGVPLVHVSRILRHSGIAITANTYGHLEVEDLRAAVDAVPAPLIQPKLSTTSQLVPPRKAQTGHKPKGR